MALSKEDKADVKGALGKAVANKVSKVTRDHKVGGIKTSDYGRDVAPIFTSAKKADRAVKESVRLGAKSKALKRPLNRDQADFDAGRPLKYHTPTIKREQAKSKALQGKKDTHAGHNKHSMCKTCNPAMFS